MSASREKKARQELHASGYVDPKAVKAEEARKAAKRSSILYGSIAALFVLVAAFIIVWNSGLIQKNATAVTIDGESYSVAETGYFYQYAYNQWYSQMGSYASYFGLDTSAPLSSQIYDEETGETWADYFASEGIANMKWTIAAYNAAQESGYEWSDEDEASWTSTKTSLEEYAKSNGVSYKNILKYNYGKYITPSLFEKLTRMQITALSYAQGISDGFSFTADEIAKNYEENPLDYDVADYELVTVSGTPDSKDADGNDIEVTDEMKEEAMAAAKVNAEAILAAYEAGTSLEDAAGNEDYNATYSDRADSSYSDTDVLNWVFDDDRAEGDTTIIEGESSYSVLLFHSRGREEYNTVDVRHILVKVDSSDLDSESETYEADLEERKAAAKAEADELLKQWKDGEKSEASFGALADEHSDDGAEGGLYTAVAKGDMVSEFNDWIFAEGRRTGDADVIYSESTNGYHVMYFVGENVPCWQADSEYDLRTAAYSEWSEALVADMTAEEGSGMKYVKN